MSFSKRGTEIFVNTYTDNIQGNPSIGANPFNGGYQIVWESGGQDGNDIQISDMTIDDQENPGVTFHENGEGS